MLHELSLRVDDSRSGERLDRHIIRNLPEPAPARARIQAWIRQGRVLLDGVTCLKPSQRLAAGQRVQINLPDQSKDLEPVPGKLDIVYLDRDIVVVNKPADLSVHPSSSDTRPTLVHYLLHKCPGLTMQADKQRPGIVHRLDKDTTGLMVSALNQEATEDLSRQFARRTVDKKYLALVWGLVQKDQGRVELPLGRDPQNKTRMAVYREGRAARTSFRVLKRDPQGLYSFLEVKILTGRTHQIRVHLSHSGHPVAGDRVYGGTEWSRAGLKKRFLPRLAKRQLLHAWRLGFRHPVSGQWLKFSTAMPGDFIRSMLWLDRKCQKVIITGSAGCGKSTVMEYFRQRRYPVFSADESVSDLYQPGRDGWVMLKKRFGSRFVPDDDQPVDKKMLMAAVIQEPLLMEEIMHLVHPLVQSRLEEFWEKHSDRRLALAEVPLWFESGMAEQDCLNVGVFCPDFLRRQRIYADRGWTGEVFERLDKLQLPQPEKMRRCQLLLDNSQEKDRIRERAAALDRLLQGLRRKNARILLQHIKAMA